MSQSLAAMHAGSPERIDREMPHAGFSSWDRTLGRVSCWVGLIVGAGWSVLAILTVLYNANPATARLPFADPYRPAESILLVPLAALLIACMAAVHAYAPPELKRFSLLSLIFMSLAMGTTTLVNFSDFLILTHPIQMAGAPWLGLFFPAQRPGVVGSIDLLAWGWFFGLSMMAAAPVFRDGRLEKTARAFMLGSGLLPIAGWVLMIFVPSASVPALILQATGWGVLLLVVLYLLARLFDQAQPVRR